MQSTMQSVASASFRVYSPHLKRHCIALEAVWPSVQHSADGNGFWLPTHFNSLVLKSLEGSRQSLQLATQSSMSWFGGSAYSPHWNKQASSLSMSMVLQLLVGACVGAMVGATVATAVGAGVGEAVGAAVGAAEAVIFAGGWHSGCSVSPHGKIPNDQSHIPFAHESAGPFGHKFNDSSHCLVQAPPSDCVLNGPHCQRHLVTSATSDAQQAGKGSVWLFHRFRDATQVPCCLTFMGFEFSFRSLAHCLKQQSEQSCEACLSKGLNFPH